MEVEGPLMTGGGIAVKEERETVESDGEYAVLSGLWSGEVPPLVLAVRPLWWLGPVILVICSSRMWTFLSFSFEGDIGPSV